MRVIRLSVLVWALALAAVPSASASHSFSDVPDGHLFHTEIGIFKDTNITTGCTATTFCPDDFLRRQGMAAFLTRALGLVVRPNESTQKGVPGSRVAMLDDDASFVGTADGALELHYLGRALRLELGPAGSPNVIGGFSLKSVDDGVSGATIAGGGAGLPGAHEVTDDFGSVGGGWSNQAGDDTDADASYATVAGGSSNFAEGLNSSVGGGFSNIAAADYGAVGGGSLNIAGNHATVPGGESNHAAGNYSLAAGRRAKVLHNGSFMWADSQAADVTSAAHDSFAVRALGGVWLGTTSSPTIPMGVFLNTSTGGHLTTGGAWTNNSDRASKERFGEVDGQRLLHALAGIPIRSWSYKAEPGVRHLGPVAQDFYRAFRLGGDDRHISTIDADGVALAAIQALYRENQALEARLAKLERQVAQLVRARRG